VSKTQDKQAFRTTRWSVVRAAAGEDSAAAREALAVLVDCYWFPLYAFTRRSGYDADDAQDLIQAFFTRLLEKRNIGSADPARGRFRSYLLSALKHFMADERDRSRALKRGGGRVPVSIDYADADRRYDVDPGHGLTPEWLFERNWALALLDRTWNKLGTEYEARGQRELFDRLRSSVSGDAPAPSRRELAERLGMSETAVSVAAHRLRTRFRERLRAEVAETVAGPEDVDRELRDLHAALEL
jgi:RNA polymerase sigma-70 factor (ECF subfamily)